MAETTENKNVHKLSYSNKQVDNKFDSIAADDTDTYKDGSSNEHLRYRKLILGDNNPARASATATYKTSLKHGEGTEVYSPNSTAVGVNSVAGGRYFTFYGTPESNGSHTPKLWEVPAESDPTRYNGYNTPSNKVPPKDHKFDAPDYYVVLTLHTNPQVESSDEYRKYNVTGQLGKIAEIVSNKSYPEDPKKFSSLIEKESLNDMPLYVSIRSSWNIDFAGYLCGMYGKFNTTEAKYYESKNIVSAKLKEGWAYTGDGWNDQYQLLIKLVDSSAEYASKYLLGSYDSEDTFEPIGITTGELWFPNYPEWGNMMFSGSSYAEGATTFATFAGHAEGDKTFAGGKNSHAEGLVTRAGYCAHAEGKFTRATHNHAHAEGYHTTANASSAHAEGSNTWASSSNAHAEGYQTTASGSAAHSEGISTNASGQGSHAEGTSTFATGDYAHAGGVQSQATHVGSFVHGHALDTSRNYQTVVGEYNEDVENALFVVGNGKDDTNRSNAFEVHKDGNVFFKSLSVGQTNNATNIKGFSVYGNYSGSNSYRLECWGYSNGRMFNKLLGLPDPVQNINDSTEGKCLWFYYGGNSPSDSRYIGGDGKDIAVELIKTTKDGTAVEFDSANPIIYPRSFNEATGVASTSKEKYNEDLATITDTDKSEIVDNLYELPTALTNIFSKRVILVAKKDIIEGEELKYPKGTTWDVGKVTKINMSDCSKPVITVSKYQPVPGVGSSGETGSSSYALIFVDNEDKGTANLTRGTTLGYGLKSYNPHETVVGTFNEPKGGLLFSIGCGTSDTDRQNCLEVYNSGKIYTSQTITEIISNT